MKKRHFDRTSFILMGLILIELIALVQAVFSQQVIKYNIEQQLEHHSEMLLIQFMNTYEMNSDFQNNVTTLSYQHFDKGLQEMYHNMVEVVDAKGSLIGNKRYTSEKGDYQIEVLENTLANRNIYIEQYGVDMSKIGTFKIISYEMKQSDELLLERRILLGLCKDKGKIITIEIELKSLQEKITETNQKIDELLNATYYLGNHQGSFYVFKRDGENLYNGGKENNALYFNNLDLNTNKRIIDIIRQESNVYQQVIYKKEEDAKRSLIRVKYDKARNLYFVYEFDQKTAFENIEKKMLFTWVVSLIVLALTLCFMVLLKRMVKPTAKE